MRMENQQGSSETTEAMKEMVDEIDQKRFELLDLELKLMRQMSQTSINSSPQLSNLFLIGSPLGLFISLNAIPSSYQPMTPRSQSPRSPRAPVARVGHRRRRRSNSNQTTPSPPPDSEVLELNNQDPDALVPYSSCRRVYNIYHSYDPIAYRLEPLLLKHYSTVAPVVLPSVDSFLSKKTNKSGKNSDHTSPQDFSRDSSIDVTSTSGMDGVGSMFESFGDTDSRDSRYVGNVWDSDTESSDNDSVDTVQPDLAKKLYKRISVGEDQVYKQHKSKTFKFFSRYVTRRSSHVTSLGPLLPLQRNEPEAAERRLRYRVDYEWQKSFSPLAVLGAHYSYWTSEELAFFILYQIFGHPDSVS
ncbi:unnamed protein product [Echinostoma caproni]|uniref:DDHD domain-containing protein n=1 Tax=Echinostoma caproni TaxID=27848 RepID=A0A183ABB7_9TREM|nr:unnamed protein product [Echinostoma caproni]